jgi:hypothetical protein
VHLTPIQVASLVSEATKEAGIVNSHGVVVEVEVQAAVPHVVTLLMQFGSPSLQRKREIVSEMATVTPLEALTVDEKKRLAEMAHDVFIKFDTDRSGSLDRNEFSKCLVEGKLGLTERQIAHMMAAADVSEDGLIDYSEFEVRVHWDPTLIPSMGPHPRTVRGARALMAHARTPSRRQSRALFSLWRVRCVRCFSLWRVRCVRCFSLWRVRCVRCRCSSMIACSCWRATISSIRCCKSARPPLEPTGVPQHRSAAVGAAAEPRL